ncbi:hypothetical protein RIF29_18955 [Crotalaria pallida]|uniref:Uncharacterized protein n=1 Tax=Crotalaria pallida TaxID=3830 RepID=A0AAN9EYI5_CROPI
MLERGDTVVSLSSHRKPLSSHRAVVVHLMLFITFTVSSPSCRFLCPHGLQSSSTITLTGQNLTDLLAPDLEEGVLLKQDLENEDTVEQVEEEEAAACAAADDGVDTFAFFVVDVSNANIVLQQKTLE